MLSSVAVRVAPSRHYRFCTAYVTTLASSAGFNHEGRPFWILEGCRGDAGIDEHSFQRSDRAVPVGAYSVYERD